MKKFDPKVGDMVGALTLLAANNKQRRLPGWVSPNPANAHMGMFVTDCLLEFKCSCGKAVEHWYDPLPAEAREWPRDCGCGVGGVPEQTRIPQRGRPHLPGNQRRLVVHYSLDQATIGIVENFAYERQIPISHAAEALINAGIVAHKRVEKK